MSSRPNRRLKVDRISQLPDPLICQILSHLSTKDAVKTSVLSTRWRNQWPWVPNLELRSRNFPDLDSLVSFGNGFFDSGNVSFVDRVKLTICNDKGVENASYLTPWIDAAVRRKVKHVHVRFRHADGNFYEMPSSLYLCQTLASLVLDLVDLAIPEFVSLPCLKTMLLKYIGYPDDAVLERFVSSCPVLEELEIDTPLNGQVFFRVLSRSLKRLTLRIAFAWEEYGSGVVIDAPRLSFLSISDALPESFVITNVDPNVKLVVSIHSEIDRFHSFLPGISKIRDVTIFNDTFKLIYEYSKQEPLPRFGHVSRLQVALSFSYMNWLPTFLESFPNLKSLILVCNNRNGDYKGMGHMSFSSVPECLLSSLEFVDFNFAIRGDAAEMKLARYLLENSAILKKVALRLDYCAIKIQDGFVKKLFKIPRRSSECKIVILDW
ncbi:unnamed protein product [Microthlaspi erraticum]|uniref:F-box domain-containing protein n=1 Tax=Microthlaspi erraticum TaxID=1685480 RepID=A0A6D2IZN9_9BRAS|nr:unnamed protein product [Microthlaspi erraticum]